MRPRSVYKTALGWCRRGVGLVLLCAGMAHAQLATNLGVDIRAMSMGHAVTADPPGVMSIHFNPAGDKGQGRL